MHGGRAGSQIVFNFMRGNTVRALIGVVALTAALLLSGCGLFGDTKPVIDGVPDSCKVTDLKTKAVTIDALCAAAFDAINQANVLLFAIDRQILARVNEGIWTKEQARPFADESGKAGEQVDQLLKVFNSRDFLSAKSQAEAFKKLLLLLEKRVAAAARKAEDFSPFILSA